MERKWTKLGENTFSLIVGGIKAGEMKISLSSTALQATCKIGTENYTIQRIGFWNNTVEVRDDKGTVIAKIYNEKWYANSYQLEYENKKYKLVLHNNPLAEYAIMDGKKALLSYGLHTDNAKIAIRITVDKYETNLLFDFLLWYLFVPIAIENIGDDLLFEFLLTGQ